MKKQNRQAYQFLTPFIILVSIFYVVPAILTIAMSLTSLDSSFVWEWNNFRNYQKIFLDPNTLIIVRNTFIFVGCSIVLTIILDLIVSILVTYFIKNESISSFFKSLIMIPMITPAVVYSILWIWLQDASENGEINRFYLSITGSDIPLNWIAKYPMQIVVMATVLTSLAFGAINFSSAIKSIPKTSSRPPASMVPANGKLSKASFFPTSVTIFSSLHCGKPSAFSPTTLPLC